MKKQVSLTEKTIGSFGNEWTKFQYENASDFQSAAREYFDVINLEELNPETVAADIGCGTGRWLRILAPHVRLIYGVEPSSALEVAKKNTQHLTNFVPVQARAENLPFESESLDLVMSLGVLHHIEDMQRALTEIFRVLKPNGIFMFYFYYNLDNRPWWYRTIFSLSNALRLVISSLPAFLKDLVCELIAFSVYCPLVFMARLVEKTLGESIARLIPLAYYRNKNLYVIRTDARDRFGTPLEKRFSRSEIEAFLLGLGFEQIHFSPNQPYWHGTAVKVP